MTTAATISVKLTLDSKQYKRGIDDAKKQAKSFKDVLGLIGGVAGDIAGMALQVVAAAATTAAVAVGAFGAEVWRSVDAGMQSQQVNTQLAAVLRSTGGAAGVSAQQVNDYADKVSMMTGIDDEAIVSAQSMLLTFTDIGAKVFPLATDAILDSATAMNGGALPSMEQLRGASIQLGKALQDPDAGLGALKRVGVNVDELQKKFGPLMSKEEKQLMILKELQNEFGGSAKAAGSTFAGQLSILSVMWGNIEEQLGQAVIPLLYQLLPPINTALTWLLQVVTTMREVSEAIFPLPQYTGKVAQGTQDAADAAADLAKNTKEAGKAAKGALAPFDALNVLPSKDKGAAEIPAIDIPKINPAPALQPIKQVNDEIEKLKSQFLTFFGPLIEAFDRFWKTTAPLRETIWNGLKWTWENILLPLFTWLATVAAPVFLDLLGAGLQFLNSVLVALQPLGIWLWDNFLKPAADWTGDVIIKSMKGWVMIFQDLSKWIDNNQQAFRNIMIVIGIFAALILGPAMLPMILLVGAFVLIIETIDALAATWKALPAIAAFVWKQIQQAWANVSLWWDTNVTQPIKQKWDTTWTAIQNLPGVAWAAIQVSLAGASLWWQTNVSDPIKTKWDAAWATIKALPGTTLTAIQTTWNGAPGWFSTNVTEPVKAKFGEALTSIQTTWNGAPAWFSANVTGPIKTKFDEAFNNVKTGAQNAWTNVTNTFNGIGPWFQTNVINAIKGKFDNAWDGIGKGFENTFKGLESTVRGIINQMIDDLNGLVGGSMDGLNGLIDAANGLGSAIPGFTPIPNVTAPQIPHLADGAVIPGGHEFAAVLGDQPAGQTNIEAPEATIEAIIRRVLDEKLASIKAEVLVKFDLEGSELARALKPYADKENVRVGGTLLDGTGSV